MSRLIVAAVLFIVYAAILIGVAVKNIDVGFAGFVLLSVGGILSMVNLEDHFERWSSQQWKNK